MTSRNRNQVATEAVMLQRAAEIVEEKCGKSSNFDYGEDQGMPRFERKEIQMGKILGKGGYCTVSEVRRIQLDDDSVSIGQLKGHSHRDENDDDMDELHGIFGSSHIVQDRKYMAARYLRHGKDARYAVKILSADTKEDHQRFIAGVVDLAIEARFLSVIRHPNIIKMRATADVSPIHSNFFIIVDRLYDTLSERLQIWAERSSKLSGIGRMMDLRGSKKKDLTLDRLIVGLDLSSALGYLHSHNIIYRDLKPDNIGFDVRGDVKLFDFGLSIEVTGKDLLDNQVYELSGNTGSLRYMAPEVACEKPYNHKVDVYSFGILLWQIMSLQTPFDGFSVSAFNEKVIKGGKRPTIEGSKWTIRLSSLLSRCWSVDIITRPDFSDVSTVLKEEIGSLRGDDSEANYLDRSRRTEKSL